MDEYETGNIDIDCNGCDFYDSEGDYCTAFIYDGFNCPPLPCEEGYYGR